jgi:hypothetical protein
MPEIIMGKNRGKKSPEAAVHETIPTDGEVIHHELEI